MTTTRTVTTIIAAAALATVTACSGSNAPHKEATIPVHGSIAVTDPAGTYPDDPDYDPLSTSYGPGTGVVDPALVSGGCHTLSGYTDISPGASVVISDDGGKTLALASLSAGQFDSNGSCVFTWAAEVPAEKFYGVTVTHRGTMREDAAAMQAGVQATLGM